MARTKNNFLNAKPVSKMGGKSGGVRKPSNPYSKPSSTSGKPKLQSKPQKPAPKPVAPTVKGPVPRPGLGNRASSGKDLLPNSSRGGVDKNLPRGGAQALRNATQGPKKATAAKPPQVITKPVTRTGPVKGPVPPKGSTSVSLPNSRRAGVNLPQTGARAERTATRVADLRKASAPKPSAKPANTSLLRGSFGQGAGALQLGLMGAELATQAGYARGGKNYKEFVRAQDRVPAKPSAKPAAKPGKPALSSTGVRVSDKANQRDYKAAPTGSKQYNDFRNRQIAGERERLKNVGNPPTPKAKPPAPTADQRRSGAGGNNTAPRSQTPPAPRFTGTVDEGRKMWAEKYSSSKYDGQAIQKEAKKLLDEMKKRREDKSSATKAGWDGNKNY